MIKNRLVAPLREDFRTMLRNARTVVTAPFSTGRGASLTVGIFLMIAGGIAFADVPFRELVASMHNPFLDTFFAYARWYGKSHLTLAVVGLLYAFGLAAGNTAVRKAGWNLFQAYALSGILVTTLKSLAGRWRPFTEQGNTTFTFFVSGPNEYLSFPSGDTAIAFAFSTIAAGLFPNRAWKIFCYFLAASVALGRVYHDQHWLTDVSVAALLAVLISRLVQKNSIRL